MNMAEILRKLADVIDRQSGSENEHPVTAQAQTNEPVEINVTPMVPPLQQKLDLLKKIAGEEDSCNDCGCNPCECDDEHDAPEDELEIIKRNAGMPMMSQMPALFAHIADEDEPFEG